MQAYIAISYNKRKEMQPVLAAIKEVLAASFITPVVFAEQYIFLPEQEKEMMQAAFTAIDHCDLLIAEVSDKAIGIGIEAGYAKAKNKKIIYLRYLEAEHSTTLSGLSDYSVIYSDIENLKLQLEDLLNQFLLS
jgi:2'-deoxynucleoside 5'-phosphate N-hydrolase